MATSRNVLNLSNSLTTLFKSPPNICHHCQHLQVRTAATSRRTRKALRVPASPSFVPSKTESTDHIIFNPPSSAPNIYHTPPKFLPKNDPRRKLYALATPTPSQSGDWSNGVDSTGASRTRLPPPVTPRKETRYHLKEEDVVEIRRLREEDPKMWTREKLAERFGCSPFFVGLCSQSPVMRREKEEREREVRARWGRQKREAREERGRRREVWGRGE